MRKSFLPIKRLGLALTIIASAHTASALENLSANAKDVENSQCRYPVVTSVASIEKYFANKERQSDKDDYELLGFKFVNESPFYVQLFRDLVEPTELTADQMPATIQTAQRTCGSVRCALEKIFGKNQSIKALYLMDKYRFNVAPMKYHQAGYFEDRDLDVILETMALIPPHLLPLTDIQQLTHAGPEVVAPFNAAAESSIQIYKAWDTQVPAVKKYLLFHEIAHNWAKVLTDDNLDMSKEWQKITGWEVISAGFSIAWRHPYQDPKTWSHYPWISMYSSINGWEDFAEAVSAYRFVPEKLEKVSPARYQFIKKKIFGNIEFKDGKNCQLNKTAQTAAQIENRALQLLDSKVNIYNARTTETESILLRDHLINTCGTHLKNALLNKGGAIPAFHSCVEEEYKKKQLLADFYNWMTIDPQAKRLTVTLKKAKRDLVTQWLSSTFITKNMEAVRWVPSKDYDCHRFAKNYAGLFNQQLEALTLDNQESLALKRSIAPTIGYWICADSKTKSARTAGISNRSFDFLKTWLYPRMGL